MMVISSLLLLEAPTIAHGEAKDKGLVSRGTINVPAPEYTVNKCFITPNILLLLIIIYNLQYWLLE